MTSTNEESAKLAHSNCIRLLQVHHNVNQNSANRKLFKFLSKSYDEKFPTVTTSLNATTLVGGGLASTKVSRNLGWYESMNIQFIMCLSEDNQYRLCMRLNNLILRAEKKSMPPMIVGPLQETVVAEMSLKKRGRRKQICYRN